MQKRTLLTSTFYSVLQASAGLLIHPYQTMQHLVEDKIFMWLTFLPILLVTLFFFIWWLALQSFFATIPYIGAWAFTLIWGGSFFVFWQVLLFYLFLRFLITLK
ncbi:MAG: hypothetical protein ABI425_03105 [Patescibacteria group bacterium]